jgi:hypothetical protein
VTGYADAYITDNPPVAISIPKEFHANDFYRVVVLRLHVNSNSRKVVQTRTIEVVRRAGCFSDPRGWIQYDPVGDVGGYRFIRNDAERSERAERARLIISFVDITIRLMLHSL